ncbi:MAG: protein kinase [Myxococcaceae bacterium]|nr:protein kinase [Myxococcaceae bacterium]
MKLVPDEFTGRRYGKYEVLCRLAVGGMAEIFLGFALSGPLQRRAVVLKNILPEQREDPVALQMLLDEARVTATLAHPNVAQVVDLERAADDVLMVIEFIQGANVEEIVEVWGRQGEGVPLGYALATIREAAQGLAHAHLHKDAKGAAQPIVHRDVTPRNIMTSFDGATKVLDFGIARAMGTQRRTVAGMVRGTTAYMSPEQAVGKDLDPRSDIFSLGVICHELLTGQRLFLRGNPGAEMAAVYEAEIPLPSKVNRRVPRAVDAVVMKALERNRDKRYQTATDLIRDLSLAAGWTTWGRERCAEMVRARFADRLRDLERLLVRIPRDSGTDAHPVLEPPSEGRTVMVPRPRDDQPVVRPPRLTIEPPPEDTEGRVRMLAGLESTGEQEGAGLLDEPATGEVPGFQASRVPPMPGEPIEGRHRSSPSQASRLSTPPTQPIKPVAPAPPPAPRPSTPPPQLARPSTPPPQPARPSTPPAQPGLSVDSLFGDVESTGNRTVPSRASARNLQPAGLVASPAELEEPPKRSSAPVVVALLLALVLGAGGGIVVYSTMTKQAGVGGLSLKSDRPATVLLSGKVLGTTPLVSWLPPGQHVLTLQEADGTSRAMTVTIEPSQVVETEISLDTLRKGP